MDKYNLLRNIAYESKSIEDYIEEFDKEDEELNYRREEITFEDLIKGIEEIDVLIGTNEENLSNKIEIVQIHSNGGYNKENLIHNNSDYDKENLNSDSFIPVKKKENIFIEIFNKFKKWLYT